MKAELGHAAKTFTESCSKIYYASLERKHAANIRQSELGRNISAI